jgi:prevent-host-death family protein
MTRTMKASEARQQWSSLLNTVFRKEARVIVEKSGVPVAALVSTEDLERLNQMEAHQAEQERQLDAALARARQAFAEIPEEQLSQEVAEVIDRVRAAKRQATVSASA